MFLKAGLFSLMLLLVSRVFGVLRESALAAAFGSSGMADVAIVMLTLPDWLAGVLVTGALAYVLLPRWAHEGAEQKNATQRKVVRRLLAMAVALAVAMALARIPLVGLLLPGLSPSLQSAARQSIVWSALALPAAMIAGLWAARLQHERDFVGLYSANLVVNTVLIGVLLFVGGRVTGVVAGQLLGASLWIAAVLRLAWQGWRLRCVRTRGLSLTLDAPISALPGWRIWLWAALGAGLPMTLPFVARTFASGAGEGALATFNYAWKLVELPLVLAIQLVASLAFPAIARAHAAMSANDPQSVDAMTLAVRGALVVAWTLSCAAAAVLLVGAPAITTLLFGWGRMQTPALVQIAAWGAAGAWGLLPQSLLAVALTVLATQGRMRFGVLGYALALALLLLVGAMGFTAGPILIWTLNTGFMVAAIVAWGSLGVSAIRSWMPWRVLVAPLAALLVVALLEQWAGPVSSIGGHRGAIGSEQIVALLWCAFASLAVMVTGWFSGPDLRQALRS